MDETSEPERSVWLRLSNRELVRAKAYIAGEWRAADSGKTIDVYNPATGELIGEVPDMGSIETQAAIEAAKRAFPRWRNMSAEDRANILHRWADLIDENLEDLATIVTLEQGKPLAEARAEVRYGMSYIQWYAEQGKRIYGEIIPPHLPNSRLLVLREPIGIVAAILPWNFPSALVARKGAAALAAGCPVVLRPANGTPFSAIAMARLAQDAGIPDGVLSVVTGNAQKFSDTVFSSPAVRMVTFTGSTDVGRKLMVAASNQIKRLSLELGGHAPCIVFRDADLDLAVASAVSAKFMSTGEDCLAINRILVQDAIYEEFCDLFRKATAGLKVGDGFAPDIDQGPLFDAGILHKCEAHVADAVEKGALVLE